MALTRAVREAPDDAARYYVRASRLLELRLFAEAAGDADACLRLRPAFAKARCTPARTSCSHSLLTLLFTPRSAQAFFAKGRALYFMHEYDAAFAQ